MWDGYGTAMKPAYEPVICARKPKEGTFAENALRWGVAGLNIDGGRVQADQKDKDNIEKQVQGFKNTQSIGGKGKYSGGKTTDRTEYNAQQGRWPANLILQHHPECVRIGTKKVKAPKHRKNYAKDTWEGFGDKTGNDKIITDSQMDFSDQNGNETIEEYQCHPDCPIHLLNQQSGDNVSRYFLNLSGGLQSCIKIVNFVKKNFMLDLTKYVEDLENFVQENVALKVGRNQRGKNTHLDSLIKEINVGIESGEKKVVERHIAKLKQGGYGKKSMKKFQKEWISIISILTQLIIELKTCSVLQKKNTTIIISELERITQLLMELNIDDANVAKNINHLITFGQELQERFVDIAKSVQKKDLKSGGEITKKKVGPTKENTTTTTKINNDQYFKNLPPDTNRFFYSPKASKAERNRGCERLREKQTWASQDKRESNSFDVFESDGRPKTVNKNSHPTVKSLALMKYLCNLVVSPTKGIILDPFGGSGTTAVACEQLKIPYILIEKEPDYCEIIKCRVKAANDPEPIKKIKKVPKQTNTLFDWDDLDLEIK